MAQYNTEANRVDQQTPWGSVTYNHTGGTQFDQAGYDAAMANYQKQLAAYSNAQQAAANSANTDGSMPAYVGDAPKAPTRDQFTSTVPEHWTQTTSLNPVLQAALNSQQSVQQGRSDLANSMLAQLQSAYSTPFSAPDLNSYLSGVQGIDQSQLNSSQYANGVPGLDYSTPQLSAYTSGVPGLNYGAPTQNSYMSGVQGVDQTAPTYDPSRTQQYANAAYNAADSMLSRSYGREEQNLRDSLALQGLNPMSQASNLATNSFYDSKNAAYNQLANQSLLTGSQLSNADFASQLAGFNATNAARGQAFNQGTQGFANALQGFAAQNAVNQQGITNSLNNYNAALTGYQAHNAAATQGLNNSLSTMGADLSAQAGANSARNQAYANALSKWQSAYGAAQTQREMPINEINSLLQGQGISLPNAPGYATQGQTAGPDLVNAQLQGYNAQVGAVNAQNAQAAQTTGTVASSAAAVAAAYFL